MTRALMLSDVQRNMLGPPTPVPAAETGGTWPLTCALGLSVGVGPRLFRRRCERAADSA